MSMAAFLVIGNRKVKLRFFIILAMLLAGGFYLFSGNKSAATYTSISYGSLDVVNNGLAVIIREEAVYTAPGYGEVVYLVADGSPVETDQPIAVLNKESFDEDIAKQLYDIQEKIILYQQEQLMDQVINSDVSKINTDIDILVTEVQSYVKESDYTELGNLESRIRRLLENKQKLLDHQVEPDSYLTALYDKEANLMAQISEWTIQIDAPESGYISFIVDGFENILGIDSVDKLTSEDLDNIIEHASYEPKAVEIIENSIENQETTIVQVEQPFYKIVDSTAEWYAVLKCDSKETFLSKGDVVEAIFEGQEEVSALVTHVHKEKDHSILVIKLSNNMDKMINKRVYPLEVRKTVEGLMVPIGALHRVKSMEGIYVRDRDENIFIETSIQALSDGFAIVESVSPNQVLQLHDQVLTDNE